MAAAPAVELLKGVKQHHLVAQRHGGNFDFAQEARKFVRRPGFHPSDKIAHRLDEREPAAVLLPHAWTFAPAR